jgi:hypothetical protein
MNATCSYDESGRCVTCGRHSACRTCLRECGVPHSAYEPPPPDLSRDAADAPGFLAKVKNFASAAVSHVAAGMPMCTDEEILARHNICLQCEHLKDNACSLCGCPVARAFGYVSKLSWADQECPAGKWGKVDRNQH